MNGSTIQARLFKPFEPPRPVAAVIAVALIVATIWVARRDDANGWVALGFAIMPDLTFLAGIGQKVAKGQLPPRAVPFYNAAHSLIGPIALLIVALLLDWSPTWIGAALAWATHIMVDRAVGYGFRTPEGYRRSPM